MPVIAAVGGFEDTAVGAAPGAVLPRSLAGLPQACIKHAAIFGVHLDIGTASVFVFVKHLLKRFAAVRRPVNAAFLVGTIGMPEHGDKNGVRVLGIDHDLRD